MNKPLNLSDLIANRLLSHTVSLFRFDAHLRKIIRRMLAERVQRELVNELVRADPSTIKRRAFRDRNVEALSDEAKAITRTGYRAVALAHDKAMAELAGVEEEFARTAVNRVVGMDLLTITVPDKRLKQIARNTLIGSAKKKAVAADWWAGQADDVRKAFTQAVNAGLAEGESIGEIIARVRGTQKAAFADGVVSFRDAEALVRTSVLSVSNAVRMESLKQNSDVVRGVQVLVTLDSRTSDTCLALGSANAAWDLEGKPLPESGWQYPQPPGPPFHWNCLPGDALVSAGGDIAAKSRRWYEGDLLIIRTASGHKLPCTPNHPILTDAGWLPASQLHEARYIVCRTGSGGPPLRQPYDNDVPTRIEEVAVAARGTSGVLAREVPVAAEDFHGDGIGSEVAVVSSDRLLWNAYDALLGQQRSEFCFCGRPTNIARSLAGARHLDQFGFGAAAAASRLMGRRDHLTALLHRRLCPTYPHCLTRSASFDAGLRQPYRNDDLAYAKTFSNGLQSEAGFIQRSDVVDFHRLAARAHLDAQLPEPTKKWATTDAQLARDLIDGKAGAIELDRLLNIEVQSFHGFVYNLHTRDGAYIANSIVTHNCRTILVPVIGKLEDILGEVGDVKAARLEGVSATVQEAMDGRLAESAGMTDWLNSKSDAFVNDLIGKTKAGLWRDGKLKVSQLVDQSLRPLNLDQLKEKVRGVTDKAIETARAA